MTTVDPKRPSRALPSAIAPGNVAERNQSGPASAAADTRRGFSPANSTCCLGRGSSPRLVRSQRWLDAAIVITPQARAR